MIGLSFGSQCHQETSLRANWPPFMVELSIRYQSRLGFSSETLFLRYGNHREYYTEHKFGFKTVKCKNSPEVNQMFHEFRDQFD